MSAQNGDGSRPGTVVIGIGNPFRRDDGVGPEVARRLEGRLPTAITVSMASGEPATLLERWTGADRVVVIDAMSSGAPPGTIHRYPAHLAPLPARAFGGSTHSVSLAQAIELARNLGRLPGELIVYGLEGGDFRHGPGLTPAVARAVDGLVQAVLREVHERAEPEPPSDRQ